jgi:hypothetical protein
MRGSSWVLEYIMMRVIKYITGVRENTPVWLLQRCPAQSSPV